MAISTQKIQIVDGWYGEPAEQHAAGVVPLLVLAAPVALVQRLLLLWVAVAVVRKVIAA